MVELLIGKKGTGKTKALIENPTSALILIAHDIIIHIGRRAVASISISHNKTGVVAFAHAKHRNIQTTT